MQEPSTRLIVKNVPKHVDEKRLRKHFAERGEVRSRAAVAASIFNSYEPPKPTLSIALAALLVVASTQQNTSRHTQCKVFGWYASLGVV